MALVKIIGNKTTSYELPDRTPLTELDHVITFGCRQGACGACVIEVKEGAENLSEMGEKETTFLKDIDMYGGIYRLACQCKVFGEITIKQC